MTQWFEDVVLDQRHELGEHLFTEADIITFAKSYDPQYFHVEPGLAVHSHFGSLIASGWHTVSVGHRKMVDALFAQEEHLRANGAEPGVSGPSPGVNSMVFKTPVRPSDTVRYALTVTGKRPSASIPGWGLLFNTLEAHNQRGELVYRAELVGFSKLRDFRPSLSQRLVMALAKWPAIARLMRR